MFELTFSLNVSLTYGTVCMPNEVVNFNTLCKFNRTVKLVDFSIFFECFQVSFILMGTLTFSTDCFCLVVQLTL